MSAVWAVCASNEPEACIDGICCGDRDDMFIHMIVVHMVKMAVVKIVNMAVVADRSMSAIRTMLMGVVGVVFLGTWSLAMLLLTGWFFSIAYPPWK